MKNIFKCLFFIIYTIFIFFINDYKILFIIFLLNVLYSFVIKLCFKSLVYNLKILSPFILFTVVINIVLDGFDLGILIGVRLSLCYFSTYIFSKMISIADFALVCETLCFPLKLFKVNTKAIGIIVSISICMVPVLRDEILSLSKAMQSKGKLIQVRNDTIISKPMLISIFRRCNQFEKTLISKGFDSCLVALPNGTKRDAQKW